MLNFYGKHYVFSIVLFSFLFFNFQTNAQCTGTSSIVEVCEKDLDSANQTFNLFDELGGTPQPGGIWIAENPLNNNALDEASGIVNLWAINRANIHIFTYSFSSCDNSTATVTINLGGYPGESNTSGGANACQGDTVNLFSFLDSSSDNLNTDVNGVWEEVPNNATGNLSGEMFATGGLEPGFYTFQYTTPAVGNCPERTSMVILEVHRLPNPGTPENLEFCETDDFSDYTNLNLHDLLEDEDEDGVWIDMDETGQLTFPADTIINLQEIYDTFGPGMFNFLYKVSSTQGVCPDQFTTVLITIEKQLSLVGTISIDDYCEGNGPPLVNVMYDDSLLVDSIYEVTVQLSGGVSQTYSIPGIQFSNGNTSFTLNEPLPTNVEIVVEITDMGPASLCESFIDVPTDSFTILEVEQPTLTADDICFGEATTAYLSNVVDSSLIQQSNEEYTLNYELTAPSGTMQVLTSEEITFTNGDGSFIIDAAFITETGTYTIVINEPLNFAPPCPIAPIDTTFEVTPRPDNIELDLIIDNSCDAASVMVTINAPQLNNGQYTVSYKVMEVGSSVVLTQNTIVFSGGTANYDININTLPAGNYIVTVESTQNDTTLCREQFDFIESETFSIDGIPDVPNLDASQSFCLGDYEPDVPRISDITVISGQGLQWYDTADSTEELAVNSPLIDGEDYYVTATNPENDCNSSNRSVVVVSLIETETPITNNANPVFCAEDMPTVADLNASSQNGGTIIWYTDASAGVGLPASTPLVDGTTYYATEQVGVCEHPNRLAVTATVITVPAPVLSSDPELCVIDLPTIAELEENITINASYNLVWFASATGTASLDTDDLLEEGTYYVGATDPTFGCNSARIPIIVMLDNCDPTNYDSLIPDGFSPNGDNVNDTYNLVNFQFIFPDYTLEIYNRYGKILFKGNSATGPWDGTSSSGGLGSDIVPAGVYFYVVNFNRDNLAPKQGRLYLSR